MDLTDWADVTDELEQFILSRWPAAKFLEFKTDWLNAFRQKLPEAPYQCRQVWLTQSDSSHLLCLSVSASVSVEVSLHQHLEVSQGRREERVAFTKACVMDPVWADGSRLTPPSLPTCRSETRTVPSVETRALQRSTFTQDPPPSSPYYTTISSFKCLLTEHVCKLTFLNFGGVLATTVESLERDVKNNHLADIKHGVSPRMTWQNSVGPKKRSKLRCHPFIATNVSPSLRLCFCWLSFELFCDVCPSSCGRY